jgi:hypothetical protein
MPSHSHRAPWIGPVTAALQEALDETVGHVLELTLSPNDELRVVVTGGAEEHDRTTYIASGSVLTKLSASEDSDVFASILATAIEEAFFTRRTHPAEIRLLL